jgi:hypothetical protein
MGTVYRYGTSGSHLDKEIDGLENFFWVTHLENQPRVQLDKGIAPIGRIKVLGQKAGRTPAIAISSTLHNKGSELNPWQDDIDPDNGVARYFGDAKASGNPADAPGNKLLLREFDFHLSSNPDIRAHASPLLIFKGTKVAGRVKGNKEFAGLAVIEKVELVTQYNPKIGYFTNYVYQFAILSLAKEFEEFDWSWINARRDTQMTIEESLKLAPAAWKDWVKYGLEGKTDIRRHVSKFAVEKPESQKPGPGTPEERALSEIYKYYSNESSKHKFEILASRVVMDFVIESGGDYRYGWVTRGSGDGGVDFVGKIQLGSGFSAVQIVVLGQAKCEDPNKGTSGLHLARTVARLKRGWIGAYVTTGYFGQKAQAEIIEDDYPLIKINGLVVAKHALKLQEKAGCKTLRDYLIQLDDDYPNVLMERKPEDVLWVR